MVENDDETERIDDVNDENDDENASIETLKLIPKKKGYVQTKQSCKGMSPVFTPRLATWATACMCSHCYQSMDTLEKVLRK